MKVKELERLYPGLADELAKPGELAPTEISIENSSSGMPLMLVKGVHIHSPRDPVREGRRLAEAALGNVSGDDESPLIIMGFGLGYAAEAAAELSPKRPLIIVERHPQILRLAFETRNLDNFLSRNRLVFAIGKDPNGAKSALSLFTQSGMKTLPPMIKNRALINLDEGWYADVDNSLKSLLLRTEVNKATLKRFGRRWVRNLSCNLSAIRDIPGISRLGGILKGAEGKGNVPVFLAAAGPGLDLASSILGEIKRRCVTIAVDTSLRFFLKRGVAPDFVVSVDPQYWNFRHLDRLPAPETFLVAESAVYPPCLRHVFRGNFMCSSLFPLGKYMEERVDPKGALGAGGSVATCAWDFARVLGTDTVWIAGLDLSFPGLKTHFRGALFEDRSLAESGFFVPNETWSFRALRDGQPFQAESANGGTVITDKRLSLYAAWFENRFRLHPEVKNISLSGEGLAISGLETACAEALLSLPIRRDEINGILNGVFSCIEKDFNAATAREERSAKYGKALKNFTNGLEKVKGLAEDAAGTAENAANKAKLGLMNAAEQGKVLKKLDNAIAAIGSSEVKEAAGFLFPDITESGDDSSEGDSLLKHLEFSARFYRALEETAAYNLKLFTQARQRQDSEPFPAIPETRP
ncbi:MAG: DUF115 domain-containing protein [Treponema sp.]|jgi:hypothetical protein|nr:DUF115 domain-containing protein [Treponema sp.]